MANHDRLLISAAVKLALSLSAERRDAAERLRDDLTRMLDRLDALDLHRAGAHLAQSIHCLEVDAALALTGPVHPSDEEMVQMLG